MTDFVPRIRLQRQPTTPKVRVRVLPALLPLNVSMRATDTEIQYRIGDGPWIDLIALSAFIPASELRIFTTAGPFAVSSSVAIFVLNKLTPTPTTLTLPTVASRLTLPLTIVDFAGNAGDITINAAPGENIMGLSSVTLSGLSALGLGQSITLDPSTDLSGWLTI